MSLIRYEFVKRTSDRICPSRIWRHRYLVSNNPFGSTDTVSRFLTSLKKLASFLALSF